MVQARIKTFNRDPSFWIEESGFSYLAEAGDEVDLYGENYTS